MRHGKLLQPAKRSWNCTEKFSTSSSTESKICICTNPLWAWVRKLSFSLRYTFLLHDLSRNSLPFAGMLHKKILKMGSRAIREHSWLTRGTITHGMDLECYISTKRNLSSLNIISVWHSESTQNLLWYCRTLELLCIF